MRSVSSASERFALTLYLEDIRILPKYEDWTYPIIFSMGELSGGVRFEPPTNATSGSEKTGTAFASQSGGIIVSSSTIATSSPLQSSSPFFSEGPWLPSPRTRVSVDATLGGGPS